MSLLVLAVLLPTAARAQKPDTFVQAQASAQNQSAVAVASINVKPNGIVGGQNAVGRIALSAVATADVVVTLKSTDPHLTVPDTVTISAGTRTQSFDIQTTRVQALTRLTLNATYLKTAFVQVSLKPVVLMSATFRPKQIKGGSTAALTFKLSGAAPSGGVTIALTSSDPDRLPSPPNVTISEGSTHVLVSITTELVKVNKKVTVKASENGVILVADLLLTPDFTKH
jgi:hypothetical protein